MALKPASGKYNKKGGMEFPLLQEHMCSLVINVKLTNYKGDSWRHFFAWNGRVIHDDSHYCQVNRSDRATKEGSKAVFEKLLPKEQFALFQLCSVFDLRWGLEEE